MRKRRSRNGVAIVRQALHVLTALNQIWSIDFVLDALANGRRIKCLTIVDDFTRERLDIAVDYGISGGYVARVIDAIGKFADCRGRFGPSRTGVHQPSARSMGVRLRRRSQVDC